MIDKLTGLPAPDATRSPTEQITAAAQAFGEGYSRALVTRMAMAKKMSTPLSPIDQANLAITLWMIAQEAITAESEQRHADVEARIAALEAAQGEQ